MQTSPEENAVHILIRNHIAIDEFLEILYSHVMFAQVPNGIDNYIINGKKQCETF